MYHKSSSPDRKMDPMPETGFYTSQGWTDAMFLPGTAPFSPVMSDANQSAFTLSNSDASFSSIGPSSTQEMPIMDALHSNHWSTDATNNYFVEPPVTESEPFVFPVDPYNAWYTPTDAPTETYFAMDSHGHSQNYAPVVPQTAGFVGAPLQAGYSSSNLHPGHSRVDSLYSQAGTQNAAVSLDAVVSGKMFQDRSEPRRMTVPVTEMTQPFPAARIEPDMPYGAPIQQYRTYASGYPAGSAMPSPSDFHILGSNASVSSNASSVMPIGGEESPSSPAASTSATTRARLEESDGRARTDPLYSEKPHRDGTYHCPFVSDGCQHKPTKLKCNYDKYIDSHIKPFRCKHQNCNNNRFSSTACLLRHEREAHGLHGHGNKPFLCEFQDCERSSRDNGFPRAYNLLDHMKRVHDFRPEKTAKSPSSQSASRTRGKSQDKVKKRRSTGESSSRAGSSRRENMSPRLPQRPAVVDERKQRMTEWQARKMELQHKLQSVQPLSDLKQVTRELAELQQLSRQYG